MVEFFVSDKEQIAEQVDKQLYSQNRCSRIQLWSMFPYRLLPHARFIRLFYRFGWLNGWNLTALSAQYG